MKVPPIHLSARRLQMLLNWWPPFWGAGIRVVTIQNDFRYAKVQMPLYLYNQNYVGVHFGGSLYAMCDPFYMLLLINVLNSSKNNNTNGSTGSSTLRKIGGGGEFIVWDKAASIEYVKPGKGIMTAEFHITDDILHQIYSMKPDTKQLIDLSVNVTDESGDIVAKLIKTEYIKRKPDNDTILSSTNQVDDDDNDDSGDKLSNALPEIGGKNSANQETPTTVSKL